jgi:hypothetical protein
MGFRNWDARRGHAHRACRRLDDAPCRGSGPPAREPDRDQTATPRLGDVCPASRTPARRTRTRTASGAVQALEARRPGLAGSGHASRPANLRHAVVMVVYPAGARRNRCSRCSANAAAGTISDRSAALRARSSRAAGRAATRASCVADRRCARWPDRHCGRGQRRPRVRAGSRADRRAARCTLGASRPCVRDRSCSPRPGCSTAGALPRTGRPVPG